MEKVTATDICHKWISFFTPRAGYVPPANIISAMEEYAEICHQQKIENSWISIEKELPEFTDEYNVVWDLQDGGEPLTTTMEYDSINKKWIDIINNRIECFTVLYWQKLPKPIKK